MYKLWGHLPYDFIEAVPSVIGRLVTTLPDRCWILQCASEYISFW